METEKKLIEPSHGFIGGSILTITGCFFLAGATWLIAPIIAVPALLIAFLQYRATFAGRHNATLVVMILQIILAATCLINLASYLSQMDFQHPMWKYRLKPIAFSIGFAAAFAAMAIQNYGWLKRLSAPGNKFFEESPRLFASDLYLMAVVGFGAGTFVMCSSGFWVVY